MKPPVYPFRQRRSLVAALALVAVILPARRASASITNDVLTLLNQFRQSNNVPALRRVVNLDCAAQNYAQMMGAQQWFSHIGPDGSTPGTRETACGYSATGWGENIASLYTSASGVVHAWENSPEHRANMLQGAFKDVGIGLGTSADGTNYWVMDFGVSNQTYPETPMPPPPTSLSGDVNGDGKVSIADVTVLVRMVLGLVNPTAAHKAAGDLNGDGVLDVRDTILLLRRLVGLGP